MISLRQILPTLTFLGGLLSHSGAMAWTVSVDEVQGLPVVAKNGSTALKSAFIFWGKDWTWAQQQTDFKVLAPYQYSVNGKNQKLDLELSAIIGKTPDQQLVWHFDIRAHQPIKEAIGGIGFRFDTATFGKELGEPQLLPGNRGWSWGRAGGDRVELHFDPPLAAFKFEGGQRPELRAFFFKDGLPQGTQKITATLKLGGRMVIGPSTKERFGTEDPASWSADMLDWKTSPVDLSFLNAAEKPAGKHGFLKVNGEHLEFEDGTPVRFWGTNITAAALFNSSRENIRQQARRLSELGFNLVRLHHHDSHWVKPNIFGTADASGTRKLDPDMLEKLDLWIKCLKDEGIYVWLDLHVGRRLKASDGIEGFDEISKGTPLADLRGYNYVNPTIKQAMQEFNEAYVSRVNQYTKIRYRDEPAIAFMLVTNENDITNHFANVLLPDKKVPKHNAWYMALAEGFSTKHGLPKERTWRSWEHGPAKLFLNDLEHSFNAEMIAHLRMLGVKVPIVPTNTWGRNPLASLPALTAGNVIDAHSYGEAGDLEKHPFYSPTLAHWIAAAQVAGKPLTVTEWNVSPFPVPDRHTIPLYLAATARHQGWRALMQYAYVQVSVDRPGKASNWHAYNDPALIATLPAAALMYRQGHVRQADITYAFTPSSEMLFNRHISAANSAALRSAADLGRLVIVLPQSKELPWLQKGTVPKGAKIIIDPDQSLINADQPEAVSDTRELRRNWKDGIYTIDTPKTQAAMGWIGGKKIQLADIDISTLTRNATVAVQSLDDQPISLSRKLLISLGARAVPEKENQLPFRAEPVLGTLAVKAPKGLSLYKTNAASGEKQAVSTPYKDGRYVIALEKMPNTYWLLLQP